MRTKVLGSYALLLVGILAVFAFWQYAFAATSNVLLPVSDGNYSQWTPSTGTSHFALVDDNPCNGTTDYNFTAVAGNRDSYGVSLSAVPNGATITQIEIKPCASRNTAAGSGPVMNVFYRYNGVNSADSGAYALTGTNPKELATTTFSGLSFVKSSTSTLESGAILTSGTRGARLSRIATTITYTALAAPTNLVATATTTSAIGLTWTDASSNETGFSLYRSTDGTNYASLASTSANAISYYDTGLTAGVTYFYRVQSFNAGGTSSFATASTTTVATPPTAPTGLMASSSLTLAKINLTWSDNSTNETAFEVLRSTDAVFFSHVASTSANATAYSNTGLASSTTYYYQVRAYNSSGFSSVSNTASSTTGS